MLERFGSPRVLLVGDFMLDRYVYGNAERVSPEAPVPVLKTVRTETRTGGAGNVAAAVLALEARVACVGVIGQDAAGTDLSNLLASMGAETSSLVRLPNRPTTVKSRYVGLAQHRHAQQLLRVDDEDPTPLPESVQTTLWAAVRGELASSDVLALEDYDKGVLTDAAAATLLAEARKADVPVVVDPALIDDYRRYRGATVLTPNRFEASLASGIEIADDDSLERAARQILLATDAHAVIVTLDKQGAYVLEAGGEARQVRTIPRSVYDVTGAGDEVLAALAVALAEGVPLAQAAQLANVAGSLEVERFGVVPISRQDILDELRRIVGLRGGKVLPRERLGEEVRRRKARGETVVFTNGCFDLLHMGHVRYLQEAREMGSCLIVAINSDDSVRRLKGPARPVIGEAERGEMLAALECVDFVTVFDEDTPCELLELLRPDVLVKGGTTDVVVGREIVEGYGGRVATTGAMSGLSTTQIINRIVETNQT